MVAAVLAETDAAGQSLLLSAEGAYCCPGAVDLRRDIVTGAACCCPGAEGTRSLVCKLAEQKQSLIVCNGRVQIAGMEFARAY